jgi:starch phosphorylase
MALAYTVRDRQLHRWINTIETYLKQKEPKVVCYLSAEFLLGPRLGNGLINLGIYDQVRRAMEESGLDLKELLEQEAEPGLGNGLGLPPVIWTPHPNPTIGTHPVPIRHF